MSINNIKCPNPTQSHMTESNYRIKNNTPYINIVYPIDEKWLPIKIHNIQDWYYVSSYGRIYSRLYDCLIRDRFVGHGYKTVSLRTIENSAIDCLVHRLVLMMFLPNPDQDILQVNHINGLKYDNRLQNLEWCTCIDNIKHAHENNLYAIGEDTSFSKFTNAQVHTICKCFQLGYSYKDICETLNIEYTNTTKSRIAQIKARNNWTHISSLYDF